MLVLALTVAAAARAGADLDRAQQKKKPVAETCSCLLQPVPDVRIVRCAECLWRNAYSDIVKYELYSCEATKQLLKG